jgi:hypothetical protein
MKYYKTLYRHTKFTTVAAAAIEENEIIYALFMFLARKNKLRHLYLISVNHIKLTCKM